MLADDLLVGNDRWRMTSLAVEPAGHRPGSDILRLVPRFLDRRRSRISAVTDSLTVHVRHALRHAASVMRSSQVTFEGDCTLTIYVPSVAAASALEKSNSTVPRLSTAPTA
jgi:hypothetical protein